ncbi:MAG: hypothetical protein LH473_08370, partial [Chitinophagales bacterium]|nr:hypothetical protein [Chitinophagales bacterium]
LIDKSATIENSTIIPPTFIGANASIINSVVGPFVSIGEKSVVENSIVKNSIIQNHSKVKNRMINNSMIGNHVTIGGKPDELSIGDYSTGS